MDSLKNKAINKLEELNEEELQQLLTLINKGVLNKKTESKKKSKKEKKINNNEDINEEEKIERNNRLNFKNKIDEFNNDFYEYDNDKYMDHVKDTSAEIIVYRYDDDKSKNKKYKSFIKNGQKYIQIREPFSVFVSNEIEKYKFKKVFRNKVDDFKDILSILIHDKTFNELYNYAKDYIACIYVLNTEELKGTELGTIEYPYLKLLFDRDNFNSYLNNKVYSKYISYMINKEAKQFNELFEEKTIEYVKDNYKNNSCFINAIINNFKTAFDLKKNDGKRRYKELTYDGLLKILDIPNNREDNIGLSISRGVEKFFSVYKLGLDVIGVGDVLLYTYRPEKLNTNIKPNIMRVMITNDSHIELINDELKSFDASKDLKILNNLNIEDFDTTTQELFKNFVDIKVNDKYHIIEKDEKYDISDNEFINNLFKYDQDDDLEENYIINGLNDIVTIAKKLEASKKKNLTITLIYNDRLEDILLDMTNTIINNDDSNTIKINMGGYLPKVSYGNGCIKDIKIKIGEFKDNKRIIITKVDIKDANDVNINIYDKKTLDNYNREFNKFYYKLFDKKYLQELNEHTLSIIDYYRITASSGFFGEVVPKNTYNGIDIRKCYTYCLSQINKIPVFKYFDIFEKYNNETIEPYNYYIIKRVSNDNKSSILYPNLYNLTFGFTLLSLSSDVKYEIEYFMRPSHLIDVNFKTIVDELYKSKIDFESDEADKIIKKNIVNISTGLLEKKYNKKSNVSLFLNHEDALNYARYFNAKVKPIIKYKNVEVKNDNNVSNIGKLLDMDIADDNNEDYNSNNIIETVVDKKIYAVIIEKEKELTTNFRQIKDMIYELSKLELLKVSDKLEQNGYNIIGVKTDCVLYDSNIRKNKPVRELFNYFNDYIGGYKSETNKFVSRTPLNKIIDNQLLPLLDLSVNLHLLKDEYDNQEFKEIFDESNTLVLGEAPGVGKSTSVKNYDPNCLFITPFNKLSQENKKDGIESITSNILMGKHIDEGKDFNEYDVSGYNNICFDEIFLYSDKELRDIHKYIKSHPIHKFFATGDIDQLKDFKSNLNNIIDDKEYKNKCINMIFNNHILLKINKRLNSEDDKEKLNNLKTDIFNEKNNKNIIDLLKNYGFNIITNMKDVKTTNNICYFNFKVNKVNKYVHNNLIDIPNNYLTYKDVKYFKNLYIVCKSHTITKSNINITENNNLNYTKDNEGIIKFIIDNVEYIYKPRVKCYVNHQYKIVDINNKYVYIVEEVEKVITVMNINNLDDFILSYASTCHAVQGLSINNEITVFDVDAPHVDLNFVWVAITRARDLKKVNIFATPEKEKEVLKQSMIERYYKDKIEGYKRQDRIANRNIINNKYIDCEWIEEKLGDIIDCHDKKCSSCHKKYYIILNQGIVYSNISVDRIDNKQSHHKDNCQILCVDCNKAKSNK
jgi:hypothetical protein